MEIKNNRHIIWTTEINAQDWKEDYIAEHEYYEADDCYNWAAELNNEYLGDERTNLNKELPGKVIAIADIGRWNGRFSGYALLTNNLNAPLYNWPDSCDYVTWYCDDKDVRGELTHHDGTHYVRYRMFKPNISERQIENFCDKIYNGMFTEEDVKRYTISLRPYIAKIYGW